ncbi:hypothetical protein ACKI2N_020965 [Cupriavidus sp. 30B13]|uniref:hypothetical protein n=1 Tax=Cupriavidus sp. 30B13 TaxID=3384241 RepID=UPI003B90D6DD
MPLHSALVPGQGAGLRGWHLAAALVQASLHALRQGWQDMQGKAALTTAPAPDSRAALARHSAPRLHLRYSDVPLTPGTPRLTVTAALLREDGTDITDTLPPAAWSWRPASGIAMRAGYGAVTVDPEGEAHAISVCPRGTSLSLSGTSHADCRSPVAGIEVTVQLPGGERLSQRVQPALAGLE